MGDHWAAQKDAPTAALMDMSRGSHSAVQLAQMWADYWGSETVAPMVDQTAETWAHCWAVQMDLRRVEH